MYMSKPGRPHVDNDVNIPPAQTLTVTKHTWCEQFDNDVKITHPPKKTQKKTCKTNCIVTSYLGASLGTMILWIRIDAHK